MVAVLISMLHAILKIVILFLVVLILIKLWRGKKIPFSIIVKEGIPYILKKKINIILLCIVFCIVYLGSQYLNIRAFPRLTVKYNYEEASNGENPNKTRFNISELLSEEMLQTVIERGNFSINSKELSDCLSLESAFDEREIDTEKLSSANIATEYKVVCSPKLSLYKIDARTLLNLLSDVYYEYFLGSYSENTSILNLTFDDIEEIDYIDLGEYFDIKADKLYRLISEYSQEDANFRSNVSGETFASLAKKINNFINIDIERFHSFALGNGLSKNSEEYITRMEHENRLQQTEYEKQMALYDVRLEAIEMYDEQMARIVLVPTTDEEEEFYMSRTKIGADYFADEADQALNTASTIQEEISHNNYAKNMVAESEAAESKYDKAEELIVELQNELNSLSEQAAELSAEYLSAKRGEYIALYIPDSAFLSKIDIVKGCLYTVVFGIVLCSYMMVTHSKRKYR